MGEQCLSEGAINYLQEGFFFVHSYRENPGSRVHTRSPAQLQGCNGKTFLSLERDPYQQKDEPSVK